MYCYDRFAWRRARRALTSIDMRTLDLNVQFQRCMSYLKPTLAGARRQRRDPWDFSWIFLYVSRYRARNVDFSLTLTAHILVEKGPQSRSDLRRTLNRNKFQKFIIQGHQVHLPFLLDDRNTVLPYSIFQRFWSTSYIPQIIFKMTGKLLWWYLLISMLEVKQNDRPPKDCCFIDCVSNAVYRLSLRCWVFHILGAGGYPNPGIT